MMDGTGDDDGGGEGGESLVEERVGLSVS